MKKIRVAHTLPTQVPGKDISKFIEQYLQSKGNDCLQNGKDETGCSIPCPEKNDKDNEQTSPASDVDESKTLKRIGACSTDQPSKYQRVGDEGKIVSGYYTPIADEKLQGFQSTYINIGSPRCIKEVVGIRKNSQFVST